MPTDSQTCFVVLPTSLVKGLTIEELNEHPGVEAMAREVFFETCTYGHQVVEWTPELADKAEHEGHDIINPISEEIIKEN